MTCGCDDKCELPKALQINNPGEVTLFHRVEIPASQGDDETYPPKNGLYRNVLLVYLANNHAYLYSSDGIPTRVDGDSAAGVPKGGLTGQVLMKKTNEDYDTKWETQTSANDAKLTLTRNNTEIGDFTANASVDKTIDIEVPTKTSNLTNDGATGDSTYVEATALSDYYTKSESDSTFQGKLTAGANITIDANNEISATDTTYTAGEGVEINNNTIAAKVRRVYNYLTSRPANANLTATGNGGMFTFQATSVMTTGKPKSDAHILHLEWDNQGGYDSQIAVNNNGTNDGGPWMATRAQTAGVWSDWVYLLNDTAGSVKTANIDALAVTTAKIADGAITEAKINATDWAKKVNVSSISLEGQTTTILAQVKNLGTNHIDYARFDTDTDGGSSSISDKPTGNTNGGFVCIAYCNRYASSSDYEYAVLCYVHGQGTNPYVATITNSTSSISWSRLVNNATLTIQKNGTTVQTFTANSSTNKTANITVPTKTSDLTNDGAGGTSTYVEVADLNPGDVSGEGTSITLPGTQGGRFSNVKLKGDTEQTTYSGKNLFNLVTPDTQSGITVTANTDGSFTVNGTTTGVAAFTFALPTPQPAGTYTISCTSKNQVMDNAGFFIRARNVNQAMLVNGESQLRGNNSYYGTKTFTSTDQMYYVALNLTATGVTYNNMVIYPQIERASTATDFEKFVGGVASPNPDYPQAVQTVTGEQTVAISTKNLITLDAIPDGASSGVSKTFTGSEILLNGTTTGAGGITASTATGVTLPAGTYTFTLTILGGEATFPSGTTALYIRNGSNGEIIAWNLNTRPYIVQTRTLSVATPIRIELYTNTAGQIYNNYRLGLQIESGSTATSYKPYQKQAYTINLSKNIVDLSMINVACTQGNGNGALLPGYNTRTCVYKVPVKPNTSYIVSCDSAYQIGGTTITYRQDGTFISSSGSGWLTTKTITTDANTYFVTFVLRLPTDASMTGISPSSFKLQIEEGSTVTAYTQHVELCKIGDYQDYIYKSNGTWYLHKVINRKVFTGSEYWAYDSTYHSFRTTGAFSDIKDYDAYANHFKTFEAISNYYVPITWDEMTHNRVGMTFLTQGTYNVLSLYNAEASVNDFKTWLGTHNVEIYYPLATPTDTPITGTLLDDLNAFDQATSYQGNTYITVSSVSPNLPAILSATTEEKIALPTATEANAGVVSVGDGLEVTDGGVLSLADNVVYSEDPGTPIGEVVDPYTYSTTETRIGTWIDGKPLYRKVINFGALPNATTKAVAHGLSNFRVRNFYGVAVDPSNNITFYLPTLSTNTTSFVTMYIDADNIVINAMSTNRSAFTECYITIEYTKTTD